MGHMLNSRPGEKESCSIRIAEANGLSAIAQVLDDKHVGESREEHQVELDTVAAVSWSPCCFPKRRGASGSQLNCDWYLQGWINHNWPRLQGKAEPQLPSPFWHQHRVQLTPEKWSTAFIRMMQLLAKMIEARKPQNGGSEIISPYFADQLCPLSGYGSV